MKIKPRSKFTAKTLSIASATILLLAAGYLAVAHQSNVWPFVSTADSTQTEGINGQDSANTQDGADTEASPTDKTPVHYETPTDARSPKTNELTGTINYKGVVGNQLEIRVTVFDLPSNGTCDLALTSKSSGKTLRESTGIITNPSSSTCDGFNVLLSRLSSGLWTITVNLSSGNKSGQISGEVEI